MDSSSLAHSIDLGVLVEHFTNQSMSSLIDTIRFGDVETWFTSSGLLTNSLVRDFSMSPCFIIVHFLHKRNTQMLL